MGLIFDSIISDLVVTILTLLCFTYAFFKHRYRYWATRKVEYLEPSFPFGNVSEFILKQKTVGVVFQEMYNEFKSRKLSFGGFYSFGKPTLLLCDPDLMKLIMTTDFPYFHDRDHYIDEENDPLSVHILALQGMKWKKLRSQLSPAFTSGQMKLMHQLIVDCCDQLTKVIDKYVSKSEPIDIKEILRRYSTDVIGSCAFGVECNTLTNPDAEFRKYAMMIFQGTYRMLAVRMLSATHKGLVRLFKLRQFGADLSDFFLNLVKDIVEHREKNVVDRKDIMGLLIKLKNNGSIDDKENEIDKEIPLTLTEITAQAFIFFFAGFETSSSAMTFCLYELAHNQSIQDKLRIEIRETLKKHKNELTYDAIMEMTYLGKVIKETLRKYPVAPMLYRKCVKDYKIPNTDVVIKKGTNISMPILGPHRDPEYYPDPLEFIPERFNEEVVATRPQYAYIPFGRGPRNCIGRRFGLLQVQAGIASLVGKYKFTLDSEMKIPLEFDNKCILLNSKHTIWLNGIKI